MLNTVLMVYNGKKHLPLQITEEIIGYKLGEFIMTKSFSSHIKKEKKLKHS
jgi:small subunit ribosomal protein S19